MKVKKNDKVATTTKKKKVGFAWCWITATIHREHTDEHEWRVVMDSTKKPELDPLTILENNCKLLFN